MKKRCVTLVCDSAEEHAVLLHNAWEAQTGMHAVLTEGWCRLNLPTSTHCLFNYKQTNTWLCSTSLLFSPKLDLATRRESIISVRWQRLASGRRSASRWQFADGVCDHNPEASLQTGSKRSCKVLSHCAGIIGFGWSLGVQDLATA